MRPSYRFVWLAALLLFASTPAMADDTSTPKAYLGVRIAPGPVPDILATHLKLEPGVGLVVVDVVPGGPADAAGIEPNDIIVELEGAPVRGYEQFLADIRAAGVDTQVDLAVVHEGNRRSVSAKLAKAPETMADASSGRGLIDPWGPDPFGSPFSGPPDVDALRIGPADVFKFLDAAHAQGANRVYTERATQRTSKGDQSWEVTIEGDPKAAEARITVHWGRDTYQASAADLSALPDEVQAKVKEVMQRAASSADVGPAPKPGIDLPQWFDDDTDKSMEQLQHMRRRIYDELQERGLAPRRRHDPTPPPNRIKS